MSVASRGYGIRSSCLSLYDSTCAFKSLLGVAVKAAVTRAATWQVELTQYNYELHHKPGDQNKADALSRHPDYHTENHANQHLIVLPLNRFVGMPPDLWKNPTLETYVGELEEPGDTILENDLDTRIKNSQDTHFSALLPWKDKYHLHLDHENYFYYNDALVVVEDNSLRKGVLHTFHTLPTAGHPGISKTLALIQPHYWWPDMKDFVTADIKGCATCQMNKINTHPTCPPLFPITPTSSLPFQTIAVDFITKLPLSHGYDTILTITDHDVSKASIFLPCQETINTEGVAKLYATNVFPHYGIPLKIISDRDTRFDSKFTTNLCKILGIRQNISSAYHPQTDGQLERTNQSLETYLQLYCDTQQHEWVTLLPLAQYVQNSWPSSTTKQVPFNTLIGYTPLAHQPMRTSNIPSTQERLEKIKASRSAALEALMKSQERQEGTNSKFASFSVGNKVWLEGTNLKRIEGTPKLSPRWYRPFRVAAKISHVAYQLDLPETWKIHNVFHASLLTPYRETPEHGPNFLDPPPNIIDDEPEWEIEQILKHRTFGRWKKKQYLVRWKGYSPAHDSWVNKDDMHADNLLRDFETQHPSIRVGTFRREWQPLLAPFYSHLPMSHNDVPIDISTPSPPPFLTIPNAPKRPTRQDPIGPMPGSPVETSAAIT